MFRFNIQGYCSIILWLILFNVLEIQALNLITVFINNEFKSTLVFFFYSISFYGQFSSWLYHFFYGYLVILPLLKILIR